MFSKGDDYDRFMGRWSRRLAPAMITFAEVRDGDTVLEVGSGTGALSFAIRDATKSAQVTGVEPSREFVTHAAQKSTDDRVHFEVGNAEQLRFPDAAFDKTLSLLVMNFIPDRERALSEMVRVTRPGGVVAAAVWDYSAGMQMLRVFWDEAAAFEPAAPPRDEAHMPLCRAGELGALWKSQGFQNVLEVPLTIALEFASFDDYWAPFLLGHGPAGAYVARLSEERQAALEQRLRKRLLGDGPDRALDMQARAWAVKGTVP
jgi:SAM-dependent methyltransferase